MSTRAILIKDFFLYVELFVFCLYVIPVSVYWFDFSQEGATIVHALPPSPPVSKSHAPPLSPGFQFESSFTGKWVIDNCNQGLTETNGIKKIRLNQCANFSMHQALRVPLESGILMYGTKSRGTILHELQLMEKNSVVAISSYQPYTTFESKSSSMSSHLRYIVLNTCKSCIESNAKWCTSSTCDSHIAWSQIKTNEDFSLRYKLTVISPDAEIENEYANYYIT